MSEMTTKILEESLGKIVFVRVLSCYRNVNHNLLAQVG
jgi:hypothetical protein